MTVHAAPPDGFEWAPCPRCGEDTSRPVVTGRDTLHGIPGEFTAVECATCGLWFLNPRPTREHVARVYPEEYGPHAAANGEDALPGWMRLLGKARDVAIGRAGHLAHELGYGGAAARPRSPLVFYARWKAGVDLIPRFVEGGRLLEIGCAAGERLRALRDLGWQDLSGVELVPAAAERARSHGFDVRTGRIEEALEDFEDGSFDAIVMSMVLEHLHDPFGVLEQVRRKLNDRGELLLSTVVRDSIDGKAFGASWAGFDFPRHLVFFTMAELMEPLRRRFSSVTAYHQNQPLDFATSAAVRGRGRLDRAVARAASHRLAQVPGVVLAFLHMTTRVSLRCRV